VKAVNGGRHTARRFLAALSNLGNVVTETRAAALPDPRQAALKRKIAEIRARVAARTYLAVSMAPPCRIGKSNRALPCEITAPANFWNNFRRRE
jgi:hypothetical protein